MGVKGCNRTGCDHILCDRYSTEFGYICGECFEDLVRKGVESSINVFMAVVKPPVQDEDRELAQRRFEQEFPQS